MQILTYSVALSKPCAAARHIATVADGKTPLQRAWRLRRRLCKKSGGGVRTGAVAFSVLAFVAVLVACTECHQQERQHDFSARHNFWCHAVDNRVRYSQAALAPHLVSLLEEEV